MIYFVAQNFLLPLITLYVLYTRVVSIYVAYWHYIRQGDKIKATGFPLPILGNAIEIILSRKREENKHDLICLIEK